MNYKGKLYGKIGDKYFYTDKTADDWDAMEARIKELEAGYGKRSPDESHTPPVQHTGKIIDGFIKVIRDEFKDENWDYLDFIRDRFLTSLAVPSLPVEYGRNISQQGEQC